jgi:hypothetical protein
MGLLVAHCHVGSFGMCDWWFSEGSPTNEF